MADRSAITWTDATWNPVTGCEPVSAGCDHCYARRFAERFRDVDGHPFAHGFDVTIRAGRLDQPRRWRQPRRIFVTSMGDLFHPAVPDEFIAEVVAVMAATPRHTYQLLTKRPERMRHLLGGDDGSVHRLVEAAGHPDTVDALYEAHWPLPNLWLGVSADDQERADARLPHLMATPAAIRWISAEPLLGPIDLSAWLRPAPGCGQIDPDGLCGHPDSGTPECHRYSDCPASATYQGLKWIVAGGETGPQARPVYPDWIRSLRDQAVSFDVPFLFKQWGEFLDLQMAIDLRLRPGGQIRAYPGALVKRVGAKAAGRLLDGRLWDQYPRTEVLV